MEKSHIQQVLDEESNKMLENERRAVMFLRSHRSIHKNEQIMKPELINRNFEKAKRKSLIIMGENPVSGPEYDDTEIDLSYTFGKMNWTEVRIVLLILIFM